MLSKMGLKAIIAAWLLAWAGMGAAQIPAATDAGDAALQRAATEALDGRAGAIIVLDPQTGRVRAAVNPRAAFEQKHPLGSTIKPFVALAALRAGLVNRSTKVSCATPYKYGKYRANCVHRDDLPPLDMSRALAYSCNYFFGKLGERLPEARLQAVLSEFGLGHALPKGEWQSRYAIGDSQDIRVTPVQLLAAYAALANGGQLFAPRRAKVAGFKPMLRSQITVTDEQRRILLEGLSDAVREGTASESGLKNLGLPLYGKTGTMLDGNGAKTQGWFVGMAARLNKPGGPSQADFGLAVLIYLKNANGAASAELATPVFAAWQKTGEAKVIFSKRRSMAHASFAGPSVRVRLAGEKTARTIPLEAYVEGVIAAEGGGETEPEALKALAVAARAYALKHLRRHEAEGYDFCALTHCQRFVLGTDNPAARRAAQATRGQVLVDKNGALIEAYYGASCGGMTADVGQLWGVAPKTYLRGVADEACETGPHSHWTDTIPADKLAAALRQDPRGDTGARLDEIRVAKVDSTGRAQTITLKGARERTLSGWDFKLIVGRALGWNYLKSSRFTVEKNGAAFVFRGRGFGHGLGLCQEGAHIRAQRGASYKQILARYYPGANIRRGF